MPLTLDPDKGHIIEDEFRSFLASLEYWPGRVMLDYSLMLHQAWKPILTMLPIGEGMNFLDVGTGYGLLADELAANVGMTIVGIDIDPNYVTGAREVHERLARKGVFLPKSSVRFEEGDICAIPIADSHFEFTMVREVFQFTSDPERASSELFRVTKPSGFVCVSDNDDGLYLTYPEPSAAFSRLFAAVGTEQAGYGGDRRVGRKLSTFLRNAGFDILACSIIPEARHWTVTADDPERKFLLEQVREARGRLIASGAITEDEFDRAVADLEAEPPGEQFRFNARVVVVGRKPVGQAPS